MLFGSLTLFDERIRAIEAGDEPYCTVILENPDKIIYYKRNENGVFDWMQVGEDATYKFGKPWNTRELFRSMMTFDSMMEYKPDKLCNHPLYVAALFYDDELLKNELQVLFGENNEDAMAYMEAIDHIRRLPKLSEEYNKTFTLKTEDVDVEMLELVRKGEMTKAEMSRRTGISVNTIRRRLKASA